jgi:hypothetical protein
MTFGSFEASMPPTSALGLLFNLAISEWVRIASARARFRAAGRLVMIQAAVLVNEEVTPSEVRSFLSRPSLWQLGKRDRWDHWLSIGRRLKAGKCGTVNGEQASVGHSLFPGRVQSLSSLMLAHYAQNALFLRKELFEIRVKGIDFYFLWHLT